MKQINYKKILLTHDGSQLASAAIPHAGAIAAMSKAEIIILQVIKPLASVAIAPTPLTPAIPMSFEAIEKAMLQREKDAKRSLDKIKRELGNSTKIEQEISIGSPGPEIVAFAEKRHIDLIVMSTHGRSGFGRVLLGSVADYVIRHTSCPVLIIHPTL